MRDVQAHAPWPSIPWQIPFALALACLVAGLVLLNPQLAVFACLALLIGALNLRSSVRPHRTFLIALGTLLCGYVFLGKGFAYLGAPPVFVGELVLGLGIILIAPTAEFKKALRSPIARWILVFALWGAVCSAPHIPAYGKDVFRDGVIWGYAAFALLVAACLRDASRIERVPQFYARLLPWLLVWESIALAIQAFARHSIPLIPNSQVPILLLKPGDTGVHLAGAAAFMLLGLRSNLSGSAAPQSKKIALACWSAWLVTAVIVSSGNRGAMFSILIALGVLLASREIRAKTWLRAGALTGIAAAILLFLPSEIETGGLRRISPEQLTANFVSVFSDSGEGPLEGTKKWRLDWWRDIVDYTVFGPYRWTGKGYGINLAIDDGRWSADNSVILRSPHNAHMTILARSGVPGIVLWIALQATFAVGLIKAYSRYRRFDDQRWARITLWILAYWSAYLVNGTVDVFLEGPQGGIWFWCLFGFGLVVIERSRDVPGSSSNLRSEALASPLSSV